MFSYFHFFIKMTIIPSYVHFDFYFKILEGNAETIKYWVVWFQFFKIIYYK